MNVRDWLEVVVGVLNIVFAGILIIARLQVKVWFQEQEKAAKDALERHNDDASAHANHALSVALEEKFSEMIEKMGLLTTQLAVLNERLEGEQARRKR